MHKIFVFHFQPLEKYPPVMNLLRFLSEQRNHATEIWVISTTPHSKFLINIHGIHILRKGSWHKHMTVVKRIRLYISFNLSSLWLLIRHRPQKVLYFETMSAGASVVYKKIFNRSADLFVHYHEYTSPEEYRSGMFLNKWLHQLERTILPLARWVSHTNHYRMQLFVKDTGKHQPLQRAILENFPPRSWGRNDNQSSYEIKTLVRFVHVGALSLHTMYVREWALFVRQFPSKFSWDIFSDNFAPGVVEWINQLNAPNIFFRGAVPYDQLPELLKGYDVGLVLYKGHIPNYIYNAPNKLFEYHACGLDVLFPEEMIGCHPYITSGTFPRIIPFKFKSLEVISLEEALKKKGEVYQPPVYFAEYRLPVLTQLLLEDDR